MGPVVTHHTVFRQETVCATRAVEPTVMICRLSTCKHGFHINIQIFRHTINDSKDIKFSPLLSLSLSLSLSPSPLLARHSFYFNTKKFNITRLLTTENRLYRDLPSRVYTVKIERIKHKRRKSQAGDSIELARCSKWQNFQLDCTCS